MLAAIVLTAAVVGAGVWALKPSPREILAPLRRLPITLAPALSAANTNRDFAISPDGMTIVYMANSASGRTMFARRLDSLDSSPLRRIDRAFEPFFSADGKWIGYNDEADFDLRKISITGEPPALITHVGREIRGAAWSSQDVIVFATEEGLF